MLESIRNARAKQHRVGREGSQQVIHSLPNSLTPQNFNRFQDHSLTWATGAVMTSQPGIARTVQGRE